MSENENVDWLIWRPVIRKIATLQEIETHWDINDLLDAHEALDVQDEMEAFASDQAAKQG